MEDCKKHYHKIITSAWQLLKEGLPGRDWEKLMEQAETLSKEYERSKFSEFQTDLLMAVLRELQRREQYEDEMRKKQGR